MGGNGRDIDVSEIADMLKADAENLASRLYPNGVRHGTEYCVGSVWGEKGSSMSINIGKGKRRGVWSDFASGEAGDMLELIRVAECGGDIAKAVTWAKQYLGLETGDPKRVEDARRRAAEQRKKAAKEPDNKWYGAAMRIWGEAQPRLRATAADLYLKSRGIDLEKLGYQPRALRFHPAVYHRETQKMHPALIALIVGNDNKPCGIHRIYLQREADGQVIKLQGVKDAKLTLGTYKAYGGCIRLWRGSERKALRDQTTPSPIVLHEGPENALSIVMACPEKRVWCTISVANLKNIILPEVCDPVYLGKDNDADGSEADVAFDAAVEVFLHQKRTVIPFPPPPHYKDFNDWLLGKKR